MAKKRKRDADGPPIALKDNEPLLPSTMLFRFSVPCRYKKVKWTKSGIQLPQNHMLPSFGELEGKPVFADVRAAWCEEGLAFNVRVVGKKQTPWCRLSRVEDSDGFQVWIDTRDTHSVHRARRFCHRFCFLPMGQGRQLDEPTAALVPINRAQEEPKPVADGVIKVRSEKRIDGYIMEAFIPGSALTGFDMFEHPRLGFTYAVIDRELGWQSFSVGPEFPFVEDPSLWGTLDCVQ